MLANTARNNQIKKLYKKGKMGYRKLAKIFKVDYTVIRDIIKGKNNV